MMDFSSKNFRVSYTYDITNCLGNAEYYLADGFFIAFQNQGNTMIGVGGGGKGFGNIANGLGIGYEAYDTKQIQFALSEPSALNYPNDLNVLQNSSATFAPLGFNKTFSVEYLASQTLWNVFVGNDLLFSYNYDYTSIFSPGTQTLVSQKEKKI